MSDVLVQFDDVTRHYVVGSNVVFALKEVSCLVKAKRHVAVMGASGSGKSTLLSMMAALDKPDFGTVLWPGADDKSNLRPKHVSVSFQAASLLTSLTVRQNVEVPLLILGEGNSATQAMEALSRFGLAHLADRYPDEISGGQAQRIGLARALAARPHLLLADEPTGQLDQETGKDVINTLLAWAEEVDCTVVVATHDPKVAGKFHTLWRMNFGALNMGAQQ